MSQNLASFMADSGLHTFDAPFVADLKLAAKKAFSTFGFPSKKDEDWKYTKTDELLGQTFKLSEKSSHIALENLPSGVLVLPLKEAILRHADKIKPYLGRVMKASHGFHEFNTALFQEGLFIYVPEGVTVDEPLILSEGAALSHEMRCIRHVVVAEKNSKLHLLERYEQTLDTPYFTSVVTEIDLAEGAEVFHTKLQQEGSQAFHIGDIFVKQAENSRFESHSISLGAKWARSDTTVLLEEHGAECLMNGIYLPRESQHIDHHTTVEHLVPNCTSTQDYKGILDDRARAVFNGKVVVCPGALKTEARQSNKNILLSKQAEIDTKPELQVFSDDVICSHGATVGQLDEEALFYLASRGIDKALAERYLIQAFLVDNLRYFESTPVGKQVTESLLQYMGRI